MSLFGFMSKEALLIMRRHGKTESGTILFDVHLQNTRAQLFKANDVVN